MNSEHLVPLKAIDTVFGPDWALSMVMAVYNHVLYGPDVLTVRSMALTTLRDCRFALLTGMPRTVRDRYKAVH